MYTFVIPFDVVQAASLPMATSDQQAELYILFIMQACTLAKNKTANIFTDC